MTLITTVKGYAGQLLPSWAKGAVCNFLTGAHPLMPAYKFAFSSALNKFARKSIPICCKPRQSSRRARGEVFAFEATPQPLIHYWMYFRDIRFDVKSVLEIGVETDRSIRMWEEFFPNATIYGIDIEPKCKQYEGGRRKILIGDQGDFDFLREVTQQVREPFDVIIDDGSHRVDHQLRSFDFLFPRMSDHGIYVIEDTGGCVQDFGLRTVNSMKALVDLIMYWPKGFHARNWPHLTSFPDEASWVSKNIIGIAFYRWIVFAMRGRNPGDNPFLMTLTNKTTPQPANQSLT